MIIFAELAPVRVLALALARVLPGFEVELPELLDAAKPEVMVLLSMTTSLLTGLDTTDTAELATREYYSKY